MLAGAVGGCLEPTPEFNEGPAPPSPGCDNDQVDDDEYCIGPEFALLSGVEALSVEFADFNADGHADLLVGRVPGGAALLVGRGAEGPVNALAIRDEGDVHVAQARDLDMDEDPDIVLAIHQTDPADPEAPTEDMLAVYLNETTDETGLSLSEPQTYPVGVGPVDIALVDVGGDEIADLLVVNETSSDVSILDGNGDGTFTPRDSSVPTAAPARAIAVVDVNRDGQQDLLLATTAGEEVAVLLQSSGMFQPGLAIPVGRFPSDLLLADVDANGQNDLVVTCEGSRDIYAFLHMPDGPVQGLFTQPLITRSEAAPFAAAASDLDQNGMLDIVTANREQATVTVAFGRGDGTFEPMDHPVEGFPADVSTGDLNGDGSPDLALANVDQNGGVSVVFTTP